MLLKRADITHIHTLGPEGTNLEAAAQWWRQGRGYTSAEIVLHETLERGVEKLAKDGSAVLVACIVYPELHTLVFSNRERLEIVDCFVYPTHSMVLASRNGEMPSLVASHPAPRKLVPERAECRLVNSNAQAAIDCARGTVEGCITTITAARLHGLRVVRDFGPVPMGFSVHACNASA
jgi:prephenate dehydratase